MMYTFSLPRLEYVSRNRPSFKAKSRKCQAVFEVKSRVKTRQVWGIWSQQYTYLFSPSDPCILTKLWINMSTSQKLWQIRKFKAIRHLFKITCTRNLYHRHVSSKWSFSLWTYDLRWMSCLIYIEQIQIYHLFTPVRARGLSRECVLRILSVS